MLRLRPYNKDDAETIMSWVKDESAFYKWTAGVLGEYPLSVEQFNAVSRLMAFTAIDDNETVGLFLYLVQILSRWAFLKIINRHIIVIKP